MSDSFETNGSFSSRINLPPALADFLTRYLSLRNILLALTGIMFLIAWNRGISLLYGMFSLLAAVLVVSYLAPYFSLRKVSANQRHPAEVQAGQPFELTLVLENTGRGSRYMLAAENFVPCAAEGRETVVGYVPRLRKREQIETPVTAHWRGVHRLGPLQLQSSYPLGVHQVRRPVPDSSSTITVFPATFAIDQLPIRGHGLQDAEGNLSRRFGSYREVHSLREYRRGDSMRHIHWPSSARRGELLVKQFESVDATEVLIVLDQNQRSNVGKDRHMTFEYSVTIAASIARYALEQGFRVGLFGEGKEQTYVAPARDSEQLHRIFRQLAEVQADGSHPYNMVVEHSLAKNPNGGTMVLFTQPGNVSAVPERTGAGRRLWRLLVVEFDTESFRFSENSKPAGGWAETKYGAHYRIGRHDDPAEVFNS